MLEMQWPKQFMENCLIGLYKESMITFHKRCSQKEAKSTSLLVYLTSLDLRFLKKTHLNNSA